MVQCAVKHRVICNLSMQCIQLFIISKPLNVISVQKLNFFVVLITPHTICSKMTYTVRPLPCNYCVSASCVHLTSERLTQQSSSTANLPSGLRQSERRLLCIWSAL